MRDKTWTQVKELIICKSLWFELTQGKGDWEMTRKAYNKIPLLGIYEDLDNVKSYYIPQGSQSINSTAQSISNSNLVLSLFVNPSKINGTYYLSILGKIKTFENFYDLR